MPGLGLFTVAYDPDAAFEFATHVKSKEDKKAVYNVVDKLRRLGPRLVPPHVKLLKGYADLYELRPQQGRSAVRPLYQRFGDGYVVLAIATKDDFDKKAELALERAGLYAS